MVEIRCKLLGLVSVERLSWWRLGESCLATCRWRDEHGGDQL